MKHLYSLSLAVATAAASVPFAAIAEAITVNVDNLDRENDLNACSLNSLTAKPNSDHR